MYSQEILLIEDDQDFRELLGRILEQDGYLVIQAASAKEGLKQMRQKNFDLVISDANLGDANAIDLLPQFKQLQPQLEVILLTSYGRVKDGVKAIKNGAYDYLEKGTDQARLLPLVTKALEKVVLNKKVEQLEKLVNQDYSFKSVIGNSSAITHAVELAKQVAVTDATVLLLGETGTGKEVFARAIHQASPRALANFVAINCSAFSKELLESELFGHKAGSFTGATQDKKGLFDEAHQGTLFLDEIGEMPVDLQAKLLRVLETNSFIRIGETKTTQVDVRIIAASNRNLPQAPSSTFRNDLYYRLSVFQIDLPPLRERKEDIPELVDFFVLKFSQSLQKPMPKVNPDFYRCLGKYDWKGNIRELRNVIERSIILSKGVLEKDSLPYDIRFSSNNAPAGDGQFDLTRIERQHIKHVLQLTKGNKTRAAAMLNIGLSTLYRKLNEYEENSEQIGKV